MRKIALVFPDVLPMPAVKGGATETLIQRLIDDNEVDPRCVFYVFCRYDATAEEQAAGYRYTKFCYLNEDNSLVGKIGFLLFRLRRKVSRSYVPEPYLLKLVERLKQENCDLVVVESVFWFIPFLKKKLTAPVLLHLHFDPVSMNRADLKQSLSSSDGVICVSRFIQNRIRQLTPEVNTWVLPNVVDTDQFCSCEEEAQAIRSRLGIDKADKVVLFTGRLMEVKGVLELVQAFQSAATQIPGIKLVIVGSAEYGQTVIDEYYQRLVNRIGEHLNRTIFMTGYVNHCDMPGYYAMADVSVMPTTLVEEAAGLSALEALAAGCYFIGSDSGAIPEVANCEYATILNRGEDFVERLTGAIVEGVKMSRDSKLTSGQLHVRNSHNACDYLLNFWTCIQESL